MKSKMYYALFVLLLALPSFGQPVKKVQTISESEVPVAVRRSFVENFGDVGDGTWTVSFHVLNDGGKSIAQPLSYTFRKGNGHDKVEVKFSPEGRIETSKGIEKVAPAP
ncbi:MAG TPA: hypothetical protein VK658_26230 [Chryseolinea sp.]|nr:hypothetical protein [Chryseolinea sp.]